MGNPTFVGTKGTCRIDGEVIGVTAGWLLQLLKDCEKKNIQPYLCSIIAGKIYDTFNGETVELDTSAPQSNDDLWLYEGAECSPTIVYWLLKQIFSNGFMDTVRTRMEDEYYVYFELDCPKTARYSFSISDIICDVMDEDAGCISEVEKVLGCTVEKTEFDECYLSLEGVELRRAILEKIEPNFMIPPIPFSIELLDWE